MRRPCSINKESKGTGMGPVWLWYRHGVGIPVACLNVSYRGGKSLCGNIGDMGRDMGFDQLGFYHSSLETTVRGRLADCTAVIHKVKSQYAVYSTVSVRRWFREARAPAACICRRHQTQLRVLAVLNLGGKCHHAVRARVPSYRGYLRPPGQSR